MSKRTTSVAVDISHIYKWKGRLSGIERVEYNVIKHYINKDAVFVSWLESSKDFCVISQREVAEFLDNIERTQNLTEESENISKPKRIFNKLKNKVQKNDVLAFRPTKDTVLLILDGLWDKDEYIYSVQSLAQAGVPLHHIVYDMIPVVKPGFVLEFITNVFENYMKQILPLCDRIYTISKSTAADTEKLLRKWKVKIPSIEPFLLGDDILTLSHSGKNLERSTSEYILATGTIEVRKNYQLLVYMYWLATEKSISLPKTIIVGKRGWLTEEFQYIVKHDPVIKEKIVICDNVTDNELGALYSKALFVICPSLYEGWGLPIRESLAYGKVTLASNVSSLPEAGGELADYFSPNSPESLLSLVDNYLNGQVRQRREREIQEKYSRYSWNDSMTTLEKMIKRDTLTS